MTIIGQAHTLFKINKESITSCKVPEKRKLGLKCLHEDKRRNRRYHGLVVLKVWRLDQQQQLLSHGSLLEMNMDRPTQTYWIINYGDRAQYVKPPSWFWCTLKFEIQCCRLHLINMDAFLIQTTRLAQRWGKNNGVKFHLSQQLLGSSTY